MSNPKHTPGPWKVVYKDSCNKYYVEQIDTDCRILNNGLAKIGCMEDANLIAESPMMLYLLEAVADYLHDNPNDNNDFELNNICRKLRRTIAKAKGE